MTVSLFLAPSIVDAEQLLEACYRLDLNVVPKPAIAGSEIERRPILSNGIVQE